MFVYVEREKFVAGGERVDEDGDGDGLLIRGLADKAELYWLATGRREVDPWWRRVRVEMRVYRWCIVRDEWGCAEKAGG